MRLVVEPCGARAIRGRVRDDVPPGVDVRGHEQPFSLTPEAPSATLPYALTPLTHGDLRLGDLHLRLLGPLGLCARQVRVSAAQSNQVTRFERDVLVRMLSKSLPEGWPSVMDDQSRFAVGKALGRWIGYTPEAHQERSERVVRALLSTLPPPGWRPLGPEDELLRMLLPDEEA